MTSFFLKFSARPVIFIVVAYSEKPLTFFYRGTTDDVIFFLLSARPVFFFVVAYLNHPLQAQNICPCRSWLCLPQISTKVSGDMIEECDGCSRKSNMFQICRGTQKMFV